MRATRASLGRRLDVALPRIDPVLLLPAAAAIGLAAAWGALSTGASAAIGLAAAWGALSTGASAARVAIDLAVAWSFAAAAVLALARTPHRRAGWLMASVTGAWFLDYLTLSSSPLAWTVGTLLGTLFAALLVQLLLSYPGGRAWSAPARLVIASTYAATLGVALLSSFTLPDNRNLVLVTPDQGFADSVMRVDSGIGVAITLALLALIGQRLLALRGVARRAALPLLVGGALATPLSSVRFALSVASGHDHLVDRLALPDQAVTILIPLGFLAGLLLTRLRRSEVSSLVVELRSSGSQTLRDRLAHALGDPTLEVAYWLEGQQRYVDSQGGPVALPESGERAVTQVVAGGVPVAALIHEPALLDDRDLVESVRATAGLVLENERLAAEVRAQLSEVRASRARIVAATDSERRRLERDLHDGAQQRLVGLSLQLRLAQARTADPQAAGALAQAQEDLERVLGELREFARGIHPSILREDGLDAAVETLARRASLPVEVEGSVGGRLPDAVELAAYFFVSETLTNVAKHAQASFATVTLERRHGRVRISVADDGVGGADLSKGTGLRGLADRLAAIDGTLGIEDVPGGGTTIVAEIPCAS